MNDTILSHSFGLDDFFIMNLIFDAPDPSAHFNTGIRFKFEHQIHADLTIDAYRFSVIYHVNIFNDLKDFNLTFRGFAAFKSSIVVTSDFLHSRIVTENCSAIGFPFVRTFAANFLTNAGFQPIYLPAINFMETKPFQITFNDGSIASRKPTPKFQRKKK